MIRKPTHKKLYIALFLILIIGVSSAVAAVYVTQGTSVKVGVKVGDTFTYKLTGGYVLYDNSAVPPAGISEYNATDYYKISITGINGTVVTFDTVWQFKNGTTIQNSNWVNVATGDTTKGGFWAIYPSNIKLNSLLHPKGTDNLVVNSTDTGVFVDSTRSRNCWTLNSLFNSISDPTGNKTQSNFLTVYFDKQTGMLTQLSNLIEYKDGSVQLYNTFTNWQLSSTSVWNV